MDLLNFINKLGSSDVYSFSLCLTAYVDHCFNECIDDIGFNSSDGTFYIALNNCITITSAFGQPVKFVTVNTDDDDNNPYDDYEKEFDTYMEAENYLNSIV